MDLTFENSPREMEILADATQWFVVHKGRRTVHPSQCVAEAYAKELGDQQRRPTMVYGQGLHTGVLASALASTYRPGMGFKRAVLMPEKGAKK